MSEQTFEQRADSGVVPRVDVFHDRFSPYHRLAWIWVYNADLRLPDQKWLTTGTGTFIAEDVVVTCAHIFAKGGAPANVEHVVVAPGHNMQHDSRDGNRPVGGLNARKVVICAKALPLGRRQDEFEMPWDFALVFLARPPESPLQGRPFVLHQEFTLHDGHVGYDRTRFEGDTSELRIAGYGGAPEGVLTWARARVQSPDDAAVERHWLRVRGQMRPGHSGGPIFYSESNEHRLVAVCSADDRNDPRYTFGAMITDETLSWFERALVYGRQEGKRMIETFD
jgi:Trypsin-like peptidase domain